MRIFLLLLPLLLLVGCATPVHVIQGPDGTPHLLIACNYVEECYDAAAKACAGPYHIVNTNSELSGWRWSTNTVVKLLVKCGNPAATPAAAPSAIPAPTPAPSPAR